MGAILRNIVGPGIAAVFAASLIYVAVQQDLRQSANDPQIQIAEDSAAALSEGANPQSLSVQNQTDITKSLAPFLIIYDESGKPITSSGLLDGAIPTPPHGVFDYVRSRGEDRITWQPRSGVRIATVITYYKNAQGQEGFVLAGRSLREVEKRENKLFTMVLVGLGATLLVLLLATAAFHYTFRKSKN